MIVTDLNDRERKRYATQLDSLATAATKAAEALRNGDDNGAVVQVAIVGLTGRIINELVDVFMSAAEASVPDGPPSS